jgi:flagellar biosynthesis protein FlhF
VLDVVVRHDLHCLYIANGQRVPEDLHLPNRSYLLHRALRSAAVHSPHRLHEEEAGLLLAAAPGTPAKRTGAAGIRNA